MAAPVRLAVIVRDLLRRWIHDAPKQPAIGAWERPPDRSHLVGRQVVLELHPWARRWGPTRGVFLSQGEDGLTIRLEGGGRFVYLHCEVRSVTPE